MILPKIAAIAAYRKYFIIIESGVYPSAFSVPISVRRSSTSLVIVVMQTRTATIRKNTGNTTATELTLSASSPSPE